MDVVSPILLKAGASCVINKLFDVATTYVRDQYYWETDLLEELQSLKRRLPQIQAVVGFAEERLTMYESSDPALKEWLCQFRDGIEEAEEVLDDMEYLELEKKVNSDKSMLSRTVDASVKAAKRLLKCDDVLGRLRTCVKNLNTSASASDVQNFLTLVTQKDGNSIGQMEYYHSSRITNPLPVLSFKGREEEKEKIIQYLLGESVEESEIQISENVHCLPLVAMGGMGKTALAQQVFDYFENVKKEHFDITIWVCDSLPVLNASSLMKKILEYSTRQSESGPLELMPVKLKEKLHSKRFLLVLDDVWDDKKQLEWEKLCTPLLYGQKGSWILLTTRFESVAKMVAQVIRGGTMEPMMLRSLPNDKCRSLLYEHAFACQDPSKFSVLKEIGEEIIEKLHGVPLLAKSIGGALNSKLEVDHWTSISRSEVWKIPQDSKCEFIPALTLSYMMLPSHLKRCFSYCSIFPQDYKLNKQKLVCMWVAAGLIYSDGSEEGSDEEDIANCYFDMLCNKSFFDVHTYNQRPFWDDQSFYDTARDYYTMHDMLSGLACHVSRYECCRIVHGAPSCILDSIRHLSIASTAAQFHVLTKMMCKLQHLRTLWIQYDGDSQQLLDFIRDTCKSLRRIRVFSINSDVFIEPYQLWESISDFVKLRFLEMSECVLPQPSLSKCKFYFLQVLIGLGRAKDANKLTNLRHLYKVEDNALFSVAEVGKLTSLQELCFVVGTEPGYRINELMNVDNLRKLSIRQLSNVQSLEEAKMVNLVKKRYLTRLELCWNEVSNPGIDHQEVLAALQPSPAIIRELIIREYKGGRSAPWMDTLSLSRLEYLMLDSCTCWEELPPLWKLPGLKFLRLYHMKAIRSLGCHFSDQIEIQFPVLEKLEFRDLPLWEEWNGADDYIWFPHIKSFEIEMCPKLKKIPDLPLSIIDLYIPFLQLEALPRFYKCFNGSRTFAGFQQLMSLESLKIRHSSKIVQIGSIGEEDDNIFPSSLIYLELHKIDEHKDLASYLRGLTSLTDLLVSCSQGMTSLPLATELEHLTTLRRLHISAGETLTSPGGLYILKSLKYLCIFDCPKFLSAEVESQEFLKDKTRKHVESSSSVFDHSASNIAAASILPSSLVSLRFRNSDISQESLGRCLQGLTSLKQLTLSICHHLVSLPNIEYLHNLTALQELSICNCEELCELESLTALASLRNLYIMCCPKLVATTFSSLQNPAATTEQNASKKKKGTLPSLEEIQIDNIFYLPILPIPEKLKTLKIENSKGLIAEFISSEIEEWLLQCRESLEVLAWELIPHLQLVPASLERFSSLKYLYIFSAPKLKSLPRMPTSLEELHIYGCSAKLKKRCQENIGRDWPNIKHIRKIYIRADEEDQAQVC
ncbi:LOW QUALITY PROTEIN: putative disease resistance protein RGA3 [Curcuma longa]|uniref:LOW QUALITY PROTEIN: putative disease resistance protein RGA3 n=1 Tax=Curcuma longa TaxID=136217 RepID=UPI003D9E084D